MFAGVAAWVCQNVHLPSLPSVTDDACYRAMDDLIEVEPALTRPSVSV